MPICCGSVCGPDSTCPQTDEEEDNAHEHETTVYLKSLEAVEDEHTGKRSHIDYYFDVRVRNYS